MVIIKWAKPFINQVKVVIGPKNKGSIFCPATHLLIPKEPHVQKIPDCYKFTHMRWIPVSYSKIGNMYISLISLNLDSKSHTFHAFRQSGVSWASKIRAPWKIFNLTELINLAVQICPALPLHFNWQWYLLN